MLSLTVTGFPSISISRCKGSVGRWVGANTQQEAAQAGSRRSRPSAGRIAFTGAPRRRSMMTWWPGHADQAEPRQASEFLSRSAPMPAMSRASKPHLHLLEAQGMQGRPTTGSIRKRCMRHSTSCSRAPCAGGRCTSSRSAWDRSARRSRISACRFPDSPMCIMALRLMTRVSQKVLDLLGDATGRACIQSARPSKRAKRMSLGRATPSTNTSSDSDHFLRLGLRRQCAARQEVLHAPRIASWQASAASRAGSPSTC